MKIEQYPEWLSAFDQIIEEGGVVMMLGAVDTGKTTFSTLLVNRALENGRRPCVVDADIGQSEIGPPACVGYGTPIQPIRSLSEVPVTGLEFVGATTPRDVLLEHVIAAQSAATKVSQVDTDLTIVDTTGLIHGAAARRLKQSKLDILKPRHIVSLQRKEECEALLQTLRYRSDFRIHRLSVPSVVTSKSSGFRAQRRTARFARAFAESEMRYYGFEDVAFTGTWVNAAAPLAPHFLRFMSNSLKVRVFYAEECDRHMGIVCGSTPSGESGIALIQEQFRTNAITITPASYLRHLLVGLSDAGGRMLGIGLIEAVDFRRRQLGIFTPIRAHAAVRAIQFGLVRVEPSGKEIGHNRPGDV